MAYQRSCRAHFSIFPIYFSAAENHSEFFTGPDGEVGHLHVLSIPSRIDRWRTLLKQNARLAAASVFSCCRSGPACSRVRPKWCVAIGGTVLGWAADAGYVVTAVMWTGGPGRVSVSLVQRSSVGTCPLSDKWEPTVQRKWARTGGTRANPPHAAGADPVKPNAMFGLLMAEMGGNALGKITLFWWKGSVLGFI